MPNNQAKSAQDNDLESTVVHDSKIKRKNKSKRQAKEKETKHWVVYIVECCDKTLYTGIAKDLERRLQEHNSGKGAKYTAGRRPVKLLYSELAPGHGEALSREYAIKKLKRSEKRALATL